MRSFINIVENEFFDLYHHLESNRFSKMRYFLRATSNPYRDLERGFSCHIDGWVDTEEEAWAQRDDAISDPREDRFTGRWCADPELGLSSFSFNDQKTLEKAVERIAAYIDGTVDEVAVFSSDDYDLCAGADGEDVFRTGSFVCWLGNIKNFSDIPAV